MKRNLCRRGVKHKHWIAWRCPKCKYVALAYHRVWYGCPQCGKVFFVP